MADIALRDEIACALMRDVAFDGLSWHAVQKCCEVRGYEPAMAKALFPGKLPEVLTHFSQVITQQMLEELSCVDTKDMPIRERVLRACMTRFKILEQYKEGVRESAAFFANPMRKPVLMGLVWGVSDVIWQWAGDRALDYNRYTKRGLLSGVIMIAQIVWLADKPPLEKTERFLKNRLDNVVSFGKIANPIMDKVLAFRKK